MATLTTDCDLNVVTGEVTHVSVDFCFPGRLPCILARRYSSLAPTDGAFGFGWRTNLGLSLRRDGNRWLLGGAGRGDDLLDATPDPDVFATESGAYRLEPVNRRWVVKARDGSAWRFAVDADRAGVHRLLEWTDLDSNEVRYEYDEWDRLVMIVDCDGREIRFGYDSASRVSALVVSHPEFDRSYELATYRYSDEGDLISVTDRTGRPVRYEYVDHRLVSVTNRLGGTYYFAYDDQYRCIERWRSDGGKRRVIRRDPAAGRIEMTDSYGYRTLLFVDDQSRVVRSIDALGRARENVYDGAGGLVFSSVSIVGPPCVTKWNEASSTEVESCGGQETITIFNGFDLPVRITAPGNLVSIFDYDTKGHLTRIVEPGGLEMRLSYSPRGDISQFITPDGRDYRSERHPFATRFEDQLGLLGVEKRDLFGRPILFVGPIGDQITLYYDGAGDLSRVVWADGSETTYAYDAEGQPVEMRDGNDGPVRMDSDEFGRPTGISDPTGARYVFAWDLEDRDIAVTNPRGARAEYSYDPVGRIVHITHFDGRMTLIDYDDDDNPIRQVNPETGSETTAEYTQLGDVAHRKSTRGTEWTFGYDEHAALVQASSDLGDWSIQWTPDGSLAGEETPWRKYTLTRDVLDRRTSLADDHGLRIDYTWDLRSRLSALTVNGEHRWVFHYDPRDLIVGMDCPGGLRLDLCYDLMRRMTQRVLTTASGTILASRRFEWVPPNILAAFDDWRLGSRRYHVDRIGRILGVEPSNRDAEHIEHDLASNVLTTAFGDRIVVDSGNRVLNAGRMTFQYNGDGHIAVRQDSGATTEFEYDGDDLLIRERRGDGSVIEHQYDFLGRRIAKRVGEQLTRYSWDGCALQAERRHDGGTSTYIMLPDTPIPLGVLRDGELFILLFDQIGTVTEAFDTSGRLAWAGDYHAFGHLASEVGSLDQPLRALGQYHDRESGLYYNWFRHYDPSLGRFISGDPIGYWQSQNLYWYSSNPTNYVDVDGRGSFAGTTLTLNPRCDWTKQQMRDFRAKINDIQGQIDKQDDQALRVSSKMFDDYDREAICASAVKKWKDDCKKRAKKNKRKVKNTGKPCTDNDADHRRELVLGGENKCYNMTPRNASVNRSCGSQIGNALRDAFVEQGRSLLTVKTVAKGNCCTKPTSDATPCKKKSKWAGPVCKG